MNQGNWTELKKKMAIEVIADDLCERMVPYQAGVKRAKMALEGRHQKALDVEYRMGQALIALEKLGYKIQA